MDIKTGGLLKPAPVKTCVGTILTHFLHRKGWGIKITKEIFLKMGFETKKYRFCVLFT